MTELRNLPSVDKLLQTPAGIEWIAGYGRSLTIETVRATLEQIRQDFSNKKVLPNEAQILLQVGTNLENYTQPSLFPVINASGVILHTNLGRAPLSGAAQLAVEQVAGAYSNLEFDLEKGSRGSRLYHAQSLLVQLTGAEGALVVNNNAAAVLLTLSALAKRRGVVIARSQLVEIGGGFRIPDVMKQSGARLVEVGTTNRVHLEDYEKALEENPALFMRAHRSNFTMLGFTSEPNLTEIVGVAHRADVPMVDDLGSGSLLDTAVYGLQHEPMVQESIQAGVDLVCFSGDKLLGGPQAGIIVGRQELITRLRKHPLARAIRADKMEIAGLSATLLHYLRDEAVQKVPIWRMIAMGIEELQKRVQAWVDRLAEQKIEASISMGESMVGGGSLPGESLPTRLLCLQAANPAQFTRRLRHNQPPVIARVENEYILFDPRTVFPEQDEALLASIAKMWK
jgi:L-seryl-tRNA(Ser) seleniumtransferase